MSPARYCEDGASILKSQEHSRSLVPGVFEINRNSPGESIIPTELIPITQPPHSNYLLSINMALNAQSDGQLARIAKISMDVRQAVRQALPAPAEQFFTMMVPGKVVNLEVWLFSPLLPVTLSLMRIMRPSRTSPMASTRKERLRLYFLP